MRRKRAPQYNKSKIILQNTQLFLKQLLNESLNSQYIAADGGFAMTCLEVIQQVISKIFIPCSLIKLVVDDCRH